MEVIGEKLASSREEKGLSLEEVSEDLNIPIKDLENIEKGNRNAFSDIYVLREEIYNYAKYLVLDYENLVDEFNEYMFEFTSKIPTETIEKISKQKEIEESKNILSPYSKVENKKSYKKIIIIALISILLIGICTFVVIKNKDKSNKEIALSSLI